MKRPAILLVVAGAATLLLAWALPWFQVTGELGGPSPVELELRGEVAAPALAAFGVAGLALALALAISGPLFARVMAILAIALGAAGAWQSLAPLADPVRAIWPALREQTGLSSLEAARELVPSGAIEGTLAPALGALGGLLLAAAGPLVLATARRWRGTGRRFQTSADAAPGDVPAVGGDGAAVAPGQDAGDRSVLQWDALSEGDDPTDTADRLADDPRDKEHLA